MQQLFLSEEELLQQLFLSEEELFLNNVISLAPWSTKKAIIFVASILMAIQRGHSLISRECHKTLINMERKGIL